MPLLAILIGFTIIIGVIVIIVGLFWSANRLGQIIRKVDKDDISDENVGVGCAIILIVIGTVIGSYHLGNYVINQYSKEVVPVPVKAEKEN